MGPLSTFGASRARVTPAMSPRATRRVAPLMLLLGASACLSFGRKESRPGSPPVFDGYVFRVAKSDTVKVARARVWTVPRSDDVITDSTGYWRIDAGLVPGHYTVIAEIEGTRGQALRVPAALGQPQRVLILIGEDDTWPPAVALEKKAPKAPPPRPAVFRTTW